MAASVVSESFWGQLTFTCGQYVVAEAGWIPLLVTERVEETYGRLVRGQMPLLSGKEIRAKALCLFIDGLSTSSSIRQGRGKGRQYQTTGKEKARK
jgi:hypothetical protein